MQVPLFPASYWLIGKSILSIHPRSTQFSKTEWLRMNEDHSKDTGVHDCTHVTVPEHSTQLERKTKEKQNKRKTPE